MKSDDKKRRTVIILFSAFIVLSMVISIFAILVYNTDSSSLSYNGHDFTLTQAGLYQTKINGKYMLFSFYPSDLERINMSNDIYNTLENAQGIIFIFDPNASPDDLSYMDYARVDLQNQLTTPVGFGITQASNNYNLSILSCDNATATIPIVMLNISLDSTLTINNNNPNCIMMNARLRDIVALKDRIVYRLYGIMSN